MASEAGETSVILQSCLPTEQRYMDLLEQTASFNTRLSIERKMRLPFLDSQTGVAQRHTNLFHPYRHRLPGTIEGQLFTYPAKRWKKKKRSFLFSERRTGVNGEIETGDPGKQYMHQINAIENPAHRLDEHDFDHLEATDGWYDDVDDFGEPPDDGAMVDDQSDISDFEDSLKGRKRKKNTGKGRKKKNEDHSKELLNPEDKEKPYSCEVGRRKACGARYKTRPGLAYHYSHFHNGMMDEESRTPSPKPPSRANSEYVPKSTKRTRGETSASNGKEKMSIIPQVQHVERGAFKKASKSSANGAKVSANNYCDFCLGDAAENKKTKVAEELVSCSDCGRSGHPSCLQFTDNMIISVKKYPWQCIECKSCGLCGTSDNDDQLLFCDDCDRGYHMYCLNPPLSEPPEGSWSCHLCIEEFHGGKKPAGMN
ncbi:zinc finger protein ubi-d4-like isoform X2 [Physella acuta]|uniref:zinc finger protein ubi-d4-like isoform X2 n=1 Tax=Physella acuta TaxID=109671 RepID=UPI0027DB5959|nr:zinc finger protein ubi-d4-like isoform X2 [Physella acuta]